MSGDCSVSAGSHHYLHYHHLHHRSGRFCLLAPCQASVCLWLCAGVCMWHACMNATPTCIRLAFFLAPSAKVSCPASQDKNMDDIEGRVLCLVTQWCPALCDPWTSARQAPLSMGICQARILEWVAMPSSRGSSQPRYRIQISRIAGGFFTV